ncbi:MAG: DEAD/DEAH box helicase, partial [Chloroflexota bacterium]
MSTAFDQFQALLLQPEPNYTSYTYELNRLQKNLTGDEFVRSRVLLRLSLALQDLIEGRAGVSDVAVLLYQTINTYHRPLEIKQTLWQQLNKPRQAAGLRVREEYPSGNLLITTNPWQPHWLTDSIALDRLELRRSDPPVIGDGLLYAMSGGKFTTYQSEAQKAAVQACFFAPPGSTTLVTLPTGSGKSLCTLLPAWHAYMGGRIKGNATTLVIVPTVSLAMDQERQAPRYFEGALGTEYTPLSWTGVTDADKRTLIRKGITYGTLPILYLSPEALMNSELYQICLEAARQGKLKRLVIDEAHLVQTWGAGFRTEFQFLSAYQKKLLEASQGELRTILLSATVSEDCKQLLQKLFGSDDKFYKVEANRLRPEISYWFYSTRDLKEREERVMEALYYLPRPLILYVTVPEHAKDWVSLLRQRGFKRVDA